MEQSGLVLDNIFNAKPNSWVNAKNIMIPKEGKSFHNELGHEQVATIPYPIISQIATPKEIVIFSGNNVISEIGILKDNVYTAILREPLLNFKKEFPIRGTYVYNHLGELIVAFIADNFTPKIINLNNLPFKSLLTSDLSLSKTSEFTTMELFPDMQSSLINVLNVSSGGSLKSGVYYVLCSYGYEDGGTTSWFNLSNPISIIEDGSNKSFNQTGGCEAGVITNKSININIYDIDKNFKYLNIGVISKIGNVVSGVKFSKIPIINETINYVITNTTTGEVVDLKEFLIPPTVYLNAGLIESHANQLLLGDMTGLPIVDCQPSINQIEVNWTRERLISLNGVKGSYKDPIVINNFRGFRAGEVYALCAGIKLKKGGYYGIYHIPGRAANPGDKDILSPDLYPNDCDLDTVVHKFQTRSTATQITNTSGTMGYWENRNELYPQSFPPDKNGIPLANTPVRHHKFPTLAQLESWGSKFITDKPASGDFITTELSAHEDNVTGGNVELTGYTDNEYAYFTDEGKIYNALSDHKVNINVTFLGTPNADDNPWGSGSILIKLYTNTGVLKQTILSLNDAQTGGFNLSGTITVDMLQGEKLVTDANYNFDPTGSYTFNQTFIASSITTVSGDTFTMPLGLIISGITIPEELEPYVDGIEIFYCERTIDNMSIIDQSLIFGGNTDIRFHGFDLNSGLLNIKPTHYQAELLFEPVGNGNDPYVVYNFIDPTPILPTSAYETGATGTILNAIRIISDSNYFPANNTATSPSNYAKENCLYAKCTRPYFINGKYIFGNLCSYKVDMYNSLYNQRLVSTGVVIRNNNLLKSTNKYTIYGGDTFISPFGFLTWSSPNPNDETILPSAYNKKAYLIPVESTSNIGLRHETSLPYEKYFPKSDVGSDAIFQDSNYFQYGNYYGYNTDYTSINNLMGLLLTSTENPPINKFEGRIIRSLPQGKETTDIKWRIFPATLYYDMPLDKGKLTLLHSQGVILLIGHKYTLYKAILKDLLQLFGQDVYVAQSDIFDRAPVEIIPTKEGYVGYQSTFAHVSTEFGLVLVDKIRGKVFLIADQVYEFTNSDVEDKIAEYLTFKDSDINLDALLASQVAYIEAKTGTSIIYTNRKQQYDILTSIDNPLVGKGISVVYDKRYKRCLINIHKQYKYPNIITGSGIVTDSTLRLVCYKPNYTPVGNISISLGINNILLYPTLSNTPTISQFTVGNRVDMATSLTSCIQNIITSLGIQDMYSVTKYQSDVIITCNSTEIIDQMSVTSNTVQGIEIQLEPYYTVEDESTTLSIDLFRKFFISKHDYCRQLGFNSVKDTFVTQNDNNKGIIYQINAKNKYGQYPDVTKKSFIDIPINIKDQPTSLMVENVTIQATIKQILNNITIPNKSITHFMLYTEQQCSGIFPIITKGYSSPDTTAFFNNRDLVIYSFRDMVMSQTKPFMDNDGELILSNIANQELISTKDIIAGCSYQVYNINNRMTDYITYKGVNYSSNGSIITISPDDTTISIFGNAKLKTFKHWFDLSYINAKFVVIRLLYDNIEQLQLELNNVYFNGNNPI